jgi:uncharacterized protein (DUF4415 family)
MKSDAIKKPFPASLKEWEQLISEAPGEEITPDSQEEQAFWDKAVVVREGGSKAVRKALEAKRARGQQKTPTKQPVSIRLSSEVVEYFKSTGKGWQTRMDEVLRDYVKTHR